MSICEVCKERETGSFTDGSLLENYVCEKCRTTKGKCPWCKKTIVAGLRNLHFKKG